MTANSCPLCDGPSQFGYICPRCAERQSPFPDASDVAQAALNTIKDEIPKIQELEQRLAAESEARKSAEAERDAANEIIADLSTQNDKALERISELESER